MLATAGMKKTATDCTLGAISGSDELDPVFLPAGWKRFFIRPLIIRPEGLDKPPAMPRPDSGRSTVWRKPGIDVNQTITNDSDDY